MLRPVGPQHPSVYWRRRLVLLGSVVLVIVLLAVTIDALTSGGGSGTSAGGTSSAGSVPAVPGGSSNTTAATSTAATRPSTAATTSGASTRASSSGSKSGSSAGSTSAGKAAPVTCRAADLAVSAVVGATTYQVGDKPVLELQVTNRGSAPCVQDLADKQIVLKVYNGESRVWGSHDCEVQPGTHPQTLTVGAPVRVSITWSGLASQPGSCDHRQRVGAGTYTLYASLAGKTGTAAQFAIS